MDKRKRIINIVIFLILIMALVFGVYWLVSRRAAQKSGTPPATFRQFLGFDTKTSSATGQGDGDLSSDFTSTDQPAGTGDTGGSAGSTSGTTASQFTNGTLSPAGDGGFTSGGSTNPGSSTGNGSGIGSMDSTGSSGTSTGLTGAPASAGNTAAGSVCTTADVNITFTPEELARLQALQERFYAIAQTLHTDADVSTELANYSDFKLKQDKLNGLLAYCAAAAPKINDPVYKNKVPTPFWYDPADIRTNGESVTIDPATGDPVLPLPSDVPLGYLGVPGKIGGKIDTVYTGDAAAFGLRNIEKILRLNLW